MNSLIWLSFPEHHSVALGIFQPDVALLVILAIAMSFVPSHANLRLIFFVVLILHPAYPGTAQEINCCCCSR